MAKVEPLLPETLNVPAPPAAVDDNATVPVAERTPPDVITTVPPDALAAKVPKFSGVPAVIVIGVITVAFAVPVAVAAIPLEAHAREIIARSALWLKSIAPDLVSINMTLAFAGYE